LNSNISVTPHLVGDCLQVEPSLQKLLYGSLAQRVVRDDAVVAASVAGSTVGLKGLQQMTKWQLQRRLRAAG
jgi:hypothetical protein